MSGAEAALARFRKYYENADFDIPLIEQREFGIGNRKKIDSRHLSFASAADLRSYLVSNTPLFVSYSTAYYRYPDATPMQKKSWEGADLVFDLDIHAEGKYGAYALLEQVKGDARRLMDLLKDDFGISGKDIFINFSGNRGYHVHVRDKSYQEAGSDERKEIVDYVMGVGLDYRTFFERDGLKPDVKITHGPRPEEPGYRGRFARSVVFAPEKERKAIHRGFGKAEAWDRFVAGIRAGNWNCHPFKTVDELLARLAPTASTLGLGSVNTDAGVTQDLSKLIRVPDSIHGDTGLIAKRVPDLERFEPLRDAVIRSGGSLGVRFIEDVPQLVFMGESLGPFKKGEEKELPEPAALFYVLKGSAAPL